MTIDPAGYFIPSIPVILDTSSATGNRCLRPTLLSTSETTFFGTPFYIIFAHMEIHTENP